MELEESLRNRLKQARADYDLAAAHLNRMIRESRDGVIPSSDSALAIRQALAKESAKRDEYMRLLRIFTDLVVYDKAPNDSG